MSKVVGERLPEEVRHAFDGQDLQDKIGPAYLLVTSDEDGTPRPCMLSAGEILAPDDGHLRLALWAGTTTGKNLAGGQRVVLCYVAPDSVFYVKGRSRRLANGATMQLECFEITVDTVESDVHPGMPVDSPITFRLEVDDPSKVVASWQRQISALKEA